ncbi:hypothetical protein Poly59_30940 [Rubripirellula reticaptiva]|uniref:Uncharacterized protein n=1 Tax=Rubripirellula reticaptiva TaxID=2528013 RepID=A0A5C6ER30_9BACT|nr:hypothetical protein Poly59_30940 [Rubripirellula reticaptiva]
MSESDPIDRGTGQLLTTAGVVGGLVCGSIGTFLQWSYQTGTGWFIARWLPVALFVIGLMFLAGCVRSIRRKATWMISYTLGLFAFAFMVCPYGILWWQASTNPEIIRDLPLLDRILS